MKQQEKKLSLLSLVIISIFFICLFTLPSFATSSLPGDFVGYMGDPDPDGKVDFNDLMVFATAYGSETGDPNWNELCDICGYLGDPDPDEKVNFDDLMVFATNFGKECPPEPEMELIEVASKEINLYDGGIIEVTDPENELFGVKLIIEPVVEQEKGLVDELLNIVLHMGLLETCELPEHQGYLITPVVIDTEIKDLIPGVSKIEIPYNEKQLINSAVPLDVQIHVLRTVDIRMPWEELSPEQYIIENNIVTIPVNWTDNYPGFYFYTLSVDNAIPPDPVNFNDPLPGDLLYKFSKLWPFNINEGWLPGHVGIYVGEKYDEENDKPYNVIEALIGGVQRTYYEDISYFSHNSIYLGAREPEYGLLHGQRNLIIAFSDSELVVGMPYAAPETFTSMIYSGLGRGDWVKGDGNFNCVGLAEAAYEYAGIDLVSDFDEGNQEWSAHDILTPAEQWFKTVPASGIIDQNNAPIINSLVITQAIDLMNGHWMYTLSCDATDQDGDDLTFVWSRNEGEGTFSPNYNDNKLTVINGQEIKWVSPSDEGEYTITCKVIDNYGGEDSDTKTINLGNTGPVHNLTKDTYYNTIQAALDDADNNNTIEVDDGIYDESISFPDGNKIILQSVNGASSTTIRGNANTTTICLMSSPEGTTLEGFTITHESGNYGTGIALDYSGVIINNCIISDNSGAYTGGISNNDNCSLSITGSTISGNSTFNNFNDNGGGIYNLGSLTITGSTISGNSAGEDGGGIYIWNAILTNISGNTLCGNTSNGVAIADNQIYPNDYPDNDITANCNSTYDLRDIGPAGGWIFYDKGSYSDGWRYLEAAPASTEWTDEQWGSYGTLIGGTETGIETGQSNTTTIVAWLNSHGETDRAAQLCDALTVGGYSDWFLPSLDELNLMYTNLKCFGVGGFTDRAYWSSTEYDANDAQRQGFSSGYQRYNDKRSTFSVRAVRAF